MAIVTGTVAVATIGVLALRSGLGWGYNTLFTGLNQGEVQQVVALFSEQGVDYRFNNRGGTIRVFSASVNQIRAEFPSMGYLKSGLSCDTYRNNTGLMITGSDKKQYTFYKLQDRFGTQIRLFNSVQDVKVTITEAEELACACGDNTGMEAFASVVVTMINGRGLSDSRAAAVRNLIATFVKRMSFTNVTVFDTDTMMEVGGHSDDRDYGSTKDVTTFTSLVEDSIATSMHRMLEELYRQGKAAVSVKNTFNMERLTQENTRYTTPEKVDGQDGTSLLYKEDTTNESFGAAVPGGRGAVDMDANADVPRYTNQDDAQTSTDLYADSNVAREWLHDSVEE